MISERRARLLLAFTLALALGGGIATAITRPPPAANEFNVAAWEVRHAPDKWLYLAGRFFAGGLSDEQEDERVGRFVLLTAQIERLQTDRGANATELSRLHKERDDIENDVEAVLEGRLTAVLENAGLTSSFPLFPTARWVFPPVDVEFSDPPRLIAISRRDRIELVDTVHLRPGISRDEAIAAEQQAEAGGNRSALAFNLEGLSTYPAIVAPEGDYEAFLQTLAHEWVHHYLAFKPLGRRFDTNEELRTLNETVADLAGHDLASLFVRRYPLPSAIEAQLSVASPAPSFDATPVLRQLRLDVEALLKDGHVDDAEALMEQRRQELAGRGVVFRRINQAFFAFSGLYAGDVGGIDPIESGLSVLLEREGSVGAFLRAAAQLTSEEDLRRLLETSD